MKIIRGLHNLKNQFSGGVAATIGNYDGVHLGHEQILQRLKVKALELGLPAVVVIFEPQPGEFLSANIFLRLTSLREKLELLAAYQIDYVVILAFNAGLARLSATKFIEEIILTRLHVRYLLIGDDFAFGSQRQGEFALLRQYAQKEKFTVEAMPTFRLAGVRVSSSAVRAALLRGDIGLAAKFLGRSYRVSGVVVSGERRGRSLGFPTANVYLAKRELPLAGVYAVKVYGLSVTALHGVANIGFRPTFLHNSKSFCGDCLSCGICCPEVSVGGFAAAPGDSTEQMGTFEVYIFNFSENIYGKKISVEFIEKIRDEKKFASRQDLVAQITQDLQVATAIFDHCT